MQIAAVADLGEGKKHHAPKLLNWLTEYKAEIRADRKEKGGYHQPCFFSVTDQTIQEAKDDGKKADPAQNLAAGGKDEDI